jgi:hypothetical protein
MQARFEQAIQQLGKKEVTFKWEDLREEVELAYNGTPSEKVYKGGYWASQGVYEKLKNFLWDTYVPTTGKTENKIINLFIDVNGIARDMYNNGWMNCRDFVYTYREEYEPKVIQKIRNRINRYQNLSNKQSKYEGELYDAQVNLDGVREKMSTLVRKRFRPCVEEDEERTVFGVPFTYLEIEYAMNAAIRLCIGADELNDAKLYPNINMDEYDSDEEEEDEEKKDDASQGKDE